MPHRHRLYVGLLERSVSCSFVAELAQVTLRAYQSRYSRYQQTCERTGIAPISIPTSEQTVRLLVAFLADKGIAHSIQKYALLALRHVRFRHNLGNPTFSLSATVGVLVLRGITRSTASPKRQQRLPTTLDVYYSD